MTMQCALDSQDFDQPAKVPVCSTCNDTHMMSLGGEDDSHLVMCTRCPVPCQKCRVNGNGPYCTTTPCGCECHGMKTALAPCVRCGGLGSGDKHVDDVCNDMCGTWCGSLPTAEALEAERDAYRAALCDLVADASALVGVRVPERDEACDFRDERGTWKPLERARAVLKTGVYKTKELGAPPATHEPRCAHPGVGLISPEAWATDWIDGKYASEHIDPNLTFIRAIQANARNAAIEEAVVEFESWRKLTPVKRPVIAIDNIVEALRKLKTPEGA